MYCVTYIGNDNIVNHFVFLDGIEVLAYIEDTFDMSEDTYNARSMLNEVSIVKSDGKMRSISIKDKGDIYISHEDIS